MNRLFFLLFICFLVPVHYSMAEETSSDESGDECARFEIGEEILIKEDLNIIRERILKIVDQKPVSLSSGKLFAVWDDGVCSPVFDDTYLVAKFGFYFPQIVGYVNGHTIHSARIDTVGGDDVLSVFYGAGAHQFVLAMYRFVVNEDRFQRIERIEIDGRSTDSLASNMRSIGVEGNRVVVKNSFWETVEEDRINRWIIVKSYLYQNGKFVFEKEERLD